jgi:hypothetical protein
MEVSMEADCGRHEVASFFGFCFGEEKEREMTF